MVVIGAKRLGSLYFDVSLLSDYPYENEILIGPSQHLEIRNIIINNYDNQMYFNGMYIMDAIIGHKLGFNYKENINYQIYSIYMASFKGRTKLCRKRLTVTQ
eukprot:23375_1